MSVFTRIVSDAARIKCSRTPPASRGSLRCFWRKRGGCSFLSTHIFQTRRGIEETIKSAARFCCRTRLFMISCMIFLRWSESSWSGQSERLQIFSPIKRKAHQRSWGEYQRIFLVLLQSFMHAYSWITAECWWNEMCNLVRLLFQSDLLHHAALCKIGRRKTHLSFVISAQVRAVLWTWLSGQLNRLPSIGLRLKHEFLLIR